MWTCISIPFRHHIKTNSTSMWSLTELYRTRESCTIPVYWVFPQLFFLRSPGYSSARSSGVAELTSGVGWFPTACSGSGARFMWEAWQECCASLRDYLVGGGSRATADMPRNERSSPRAEGCTESSWRHQARRDRPVLCCNTPSKGNLVFK